MYLSIKHFITLLDVSHSSRQAGTNTEVASAEAAKERATNTATMLMRDMTIASRS